MTDVRWPFGYRPGVSAPTEQENSIPYGATAQVNTLYAKNGGFIIFVSKRKGDRVDSAPFVANSIDDAMNIIRQQLEDLQT